MSEPDKTIEFLSQKAGYAKGFPFATLNADRQKQEIGAAIGKLKISFPKPGRRKVWKGLIVAGAAILTIKLVLGYQGGENKSVEVYQIKQTVDQKTGFLKFDEIGLSVVVFVTTTGASTWVVPSNWNNADNTIIGIAGGAGGRSGAGNYGGGGGGGGACSINTNQNLTTGATVYLNVGGGGAANVSGGDTWLNKAANSAPAVAGNGILAKGGAAGSGNAYIGGGGGDASTGVGNTKYSGGSGAVGGINDVSGSGGGGAAGPLGNGGNGGGTDP